MFEQISELIRKSDFHSKNCCENCNATNESVVSKPKVSMIIEKNILLEFKVLYPLEGVLKIFPPKHLVKTSLKQFIRRAFCNALNM